MIAVSGVLSSCEAFAKNSLRISSPCFTAVISDSTIIVMPPSRQRIDVRYTSCAAVVNSKTLFMRSFTASETAEINFSFAERTV